MNQPEGKAGEKKSEKAAGRKKHQPLSKEKAGRCFTEIFPKPNFRQ